MLTILLRKERLAIAVGWPLFTFMLNLWGHYASLDWFFAGVCAGLFLIVLRCFGLLAAVFCHFVFFLCRFYPLTADLSAWYAGSMLFALSVCVCVSAYGLYTSL